MNTSALIAAIAPVMLLTALGFSAGKWRRFDAGQAKGFSGLALGYALPAALFLGMAHLDRALLLRQGWIVLVMVLGYSGLFFALYGILRALGMDNLKATLLGYAIASSSIPIYGRTILDPIYGKEIGIGIVGLVALVTNLAQVAVAVLLLQRASAGPGPPPSALTSLRRSAANPLVWCSVLGAALALWGVRLSPYVSDALRPLADSSAGVAIFASGLVLAAHPIALRSKTVVLGSLGCLIAKPALFFGLIKLMGLTGTMAQATLVGSAMPPATIAVLFAQQYGKAQPEIASIMLITTIGMLAALPASIALSALL
jgi:malonate transporter